MKTVYLLRSTPKVVLFRRAIRTHAQVKKPWNRRNMNASKTVRCNLAPEKLSLVYHKKVNLERFVCV